MAGWSHLPITILERILNNLDRDDIARSTVVCRHWNDLITSDWYRKQLRTRLRDNPMSWCWLVSCGGSPDHPTAGGTALHLIAWNLHLRRHFKLIDVDRCPAARSHPKCCWFDFAAADNHVAWACRHTPTSVCCARPLAPSSKHSLLDLPPFPESLVYEFRLGLLVEREADTARCTGYRLAVLRLGWPHSEAANASVTLTAAVYRSATGRWETQQARVKQELKRWGSSVVCRNLFYVLMRPPNEHGPMTSLLGYKMFGEGEVWSHVEVMLPEPVRYSWQTKMDLVDRSGTLMLVLFEMEEAVLKVFQAEEVTGNRVARQRWVLVSSMHGATCRRFCEELGGAAGSYRCRGYKDFIYLSGPASGFGFVFWVSHRTWHQVDFSAFPGDNPRYLFALLA